VVPQSRFRRHCSKGHLEWNDRGVANYRRQISKRLSIPVTRVLDGNGISSESWDAQTTTMKLEARKAAKRLCIGTVVRRSVIYVYVPENDSYFCLVEQNIICKSWRCNFGLCLVRLTVNVPPLFAGSDLWSKMDMPIALLALQWYCTVLYDRCAAFIECIKLINHRNCTVEYRYSRRCGDSVV